MTNHISKLVAALLLVGTSASAQDTSFYADFSLGTWGNSDGGSGMASNGGIDGVDSRFGGALSLGAMRDLSNGFSGQVDLNYAMLSEASSGLDVDDSTTFHSDVALRLFRDFGSVTGGAFVGMGAHEDDGDSDEAMGYSFAGVEVSKDNSNGSVYGQIGFLDSFDEYDEGTQDAPFLQVGGTYDLTNDYTLSGALGFAGGDKYSSDDPNSILNLQVGVERQLSGRPISVFANYEFTQISYNDGTVYGDQFQTINVGIRFNTGSHGNRAARLPSFGKWVAYNANEIE